MIVIKIFGSGVAVTSFDIETVNIHKGVCVRLLQKRNVRNLVIYFIAFEAEKK